MRPFSGYAMSKKFATTVIASGFIDKRIKATNYGDRYVAVVGPKGGFKGWVLAIFAGGDDD